jgi:hypothetical protein
LGAKGVKGLKGTSPQGAKGPVGDSPKGIKGNIGNSPPGDPGPAGTSPKGNKGIGGSPAPFGAPGPTGPQGPQGGPGNTGLTGPVGFKGPQGDEGPGGPGGPQGNQGNQGAAGDKGPKGARGNNPLKGPKGAKGDTGPSCFLLEVGYSPDSCEQACESGGTNVYSDLSSLGDDILLYEGGACGQCALQGFYSDGTNCYFFNGGGDPCTTTTVLEGPCNKSDVRIKRGVKTLENPIGNIMKLEPMEYTWKKGTKEYDTFGEKEEIGFIAQQIEKIYPEIVINKKDGYLSLMYNRLTSILIEGIRHQQNDLVSVNDEISKLEILLGSE